MSVQINHCLMANQSRIFAIIWKISEPIKHQGARFLTEQSKASMTFEAEFGRLGSLEDMSIIS